MIDYTVWTSLLHLSIVLTLQTGAGDKGNFLTGTARQETMGIIAAAQFTHEPAVWLWIVITLIIALSAIIGMLVLFGRKHNQE